MIYKKTKDKAIISFGKVDRLQKRLDLYDYEMSDLLGLSTKEFSRCKKKGRVLAFRVFSAQRALELEARKKADKIIDDVRKILTDDEDY